MIAITFLSSGFFTAAAAGTAAPLTGAIFGIGAVSEFALTAA